MHVLAIDTSTDTGSAALWVDGAVRLSRTWQVASRHAEHLLGEVGTLLTEAGVTPAGLDLIAVSIGPGSFTGVRIGLATVKGLALAQGTKIVGVASTEALAFAAARSQTGPKVTVVTLLDAYKSEVFGAVYEVAGMDVLTKVEPFNGSPGDAARVVGAALSGGQYVVCGTGLRKYPEAFAALSTSADTRFDIPAAASWVDLAVARFEVRGPSDLVALEPLYIRGADAALPATPLRTA